MRLALVAGAAAFMMAAGTGCGTLTPYGVGCKENCGVPQCNTCNTCNTCNNGCGPCGRGNVPPLSGNPYVNGGPSGPPTAQYAYPYYTTRAPRDFLCNEPSNIGR